MSRKTKLQVEGFFLVLISALMRPFRGKAEVVVKNPRTLAVANFTTNIGDMIMTTPVFHAIKNAYPDCRVVVVGAGKSKDVLSGNKDVDEYIQAKDVWAAIRKLSAFKPDMGVAINPSPHEIALLYLAGAKSVSVFVHDAFQSRAFRALSSLVVNVSYKPGTYVPAQYLKLLEPIGITASDTAKHLAVLPAVVSKVKEDLKRAGIDPDVPFAVFAPGAGQAYREWETARFAEVARYARDAYGAGIVVAGGPGDKTLAKHFTGALSGIPVFDGTSQTIEELKALVSLAHVVVSNDSGIAYIAEAFNIPTVIIVGISDAHEHPNGSPLARVVAPAIQETVVHSLVSDVDTVDMQSARRLLDAISASRVTKEFDVAWKTAG